eukprot:2391875-Pleurochrysis_carterae.AAC.1
MCHDFGTPVAVLKLLLSLLRGRLRRQKKTCGEGVAAAEPASSQHGADEPSASAASASGANLGPPRRALRHSGASEVDMLIDLVRRVSAALELLDVTRHKALAYAKLEAGCEMVPSLKVFNVAELIEKVASVARDTGKSNRVEVRAWALAACTQARTTTHMMTHRKQYPSFEMQVCHHVAPGTPAMAKSDARWLFMMLVNLASNAMKHTQIGSVTLNVISAGRNRLRMEVRTTEPST